MKKGIAGLVLFASLAIGPLPSAAEPPDEFARDHERPPSREQMEKVRKKIETMRMWRLTSALDLDEKSSAQLFPVLNKFDRKRAESEAALRSGMRDLREAVKERSEAKLRGILDRVEQSHKSLRRINDEERSELRKILTVEQQARFIIFQQDFDMEIRRTIAESRERRPERPGMDRPDRPFPR